MSRPSLSTGVSDILEELADHLCAWKDRKDGEARDVDPRAMDRRGGDHGPETEE